jgi:transposase InsO family protein
MKDINPKDHAEAVAIFRLGVIGGLLHRTLSRSELRAELLELSQQRFHPPELNITRCFGFSTLERWYYAARRGGLAGLRPVSRAQGQALALTSAVRDLLLEIRRQHPSASATLIRRTLVEEGLLDSRVISEPTLRRLYEAHGLTRVPLRDGSGPKTRLRWQADRPGDLWQGDVCHAASIKVGSTTLPVRIHALLDDASRFVVALEAAHAEREIDMLRVFVDALRVHGAPRTLYLDNGPTYRGDTLRIACARLGVSLLHPRARDPEAKGKIERFFRTLREGCLDHMGAVSSLHDINARLLAWLDRHYHRAPHAGLLGLSPGKVWHEARAQRPADGLDEPQLREALIVRERRRVRRDTTVSVEGEDFELDQGFLAGAKVLVAYCPLDQPLAPWVEHLGATYQLRRVDPRANAHRRRPPRRPKVDTASTSSHTSFDPAQTLLNSALGKNRRAQKETER